MLSSQAPYRAVYRFFYSDSNSEEACATHFEEKIAIFGDIYNKTYLISFLILIKSRKNARTVDFMTGSLNKAIPSKMLGLF